MEELTTAQCDAVRAMFDRYHREVVDALGLCPWSSTAQITFEVFGGEPCVDRLVGRSLQWSADAREIVVTVFPTSRRSKAEWRTFRDKVTDAASDWAIADFHPESGASQATGVAVLPALLRRSPDPLLQWIPHAALRDLSRQRVLTLTEQAAVMAGIASPPRDPRAAIAERNAATVARVGVDELMRRLAAIREDRDARYTACGLSSPTYR